MFALYEKASFASAQVIQVTKVDLSPDIVPMRIDEKFKDQLPHLLKILTI